MMLGTGSLASDDIADGVTIRPLETSEDYRSFEDLQREVWGQNLSEVITGSLAQIVQKIGGIALGAFDAHGKMIGLIFGFTGYNDGRPVHWSHMLAVRKGIRDTGVGRRLKLYQRDALLRIGVKEVNWTYDPLVARNAHFNFNSLGVEISNYVEDMYGPGEDSDLFRGIGTDRYVVVWKIDSPEVESLLAGRHQLDLSGFRDSPLVVSISDPSNLASIPQIADLPHSAFIRIEIPCDIHKVRDVSPEVAAQWRQATRRAFQRSLADGYRLSGFFRDEKKDRCFYCLRVKE